MWRSFVIDKPFMAVRSSFKFDSVAYDLMKLYFEIYLRSSLVSSLFKLHKLYSN